MGTCDRVHTGGIQKFLTGVAEISCVPWKQVGDSNSQPSHGFATADSLVYRVRCGWQQHPTQECLSIECRPPMNTTHRHALSYMVSLRIGNLTNWQRLAVTTYYICSKTAPGLSQKGVSKRDFTLFCSCDVYLDPMMYELWPEHSKDVPACQNELFGQGFWKSEHHRQMRLVALPCHIHGW